MSRDGMEFNKGGAIGPTYGVGEGAGEGAGDGVGGGPTLASAASDAVAVDERWPAGSDHGCQTSAAMASRITSTRAMGPGRTGIGWTGVSNVIGAGLGLGSRWRQSAMPTPLQKKLRTGLRLRSPARRFALRCRAIQRSMIPCAVSS